MRHLPLLLALIAAAPPAWAQDRARSSGTGFVIGETQALTNHHVIDGCERLTVRNAQGRVQPAKVEASDARRDLALLSIPAGTGPVLAFRDSPPLARGEQVITYGFPLSGVLSSGPTLTTGDVSALAGLRDNPLHIQISAPVQPGNSGGPLLDVRGRVVGVVVSKLNAMRIAQMTGGDIPQNVNFAIRGSEAIGFLRDKGAAPQLAPATGSDRKPSEIGEEIHPSVLFIQCYGGTSTQTAAATGSGGTVAGKQPGDPSFRLVNKGQRTVNEVFATPAGRTSWGRNRLESGPMGPNGNHVFRLPREGGCIYDLRLVFADGKSLERKGADLCKVIDLPVP
jgi:S1-C subfamily serine protease